jgi:putative redox protein
MTKPPTVASLTWTGEMTFAATSGTQQLTLDGDGVAGPSPVQALALGIAGCMGMDVVEILRKGRHPLRALDVAFNGDRSQTPPHRFTAIKLSFIVTGDVPPEAVRRALALSHEKYCSVSNSLRDDIAFTTEFEVWP